MTLLLVIIYISFISLGLPDALLGSAWPSMYAGLGVSVASAGLISMIIAGGTIVSSLSSDRMIRRFGTGPVTSVSVFLTAAALVGFAFSHSFISLCIWAVPLGLGAGSVDAALNNFVALHYKAKHMNWLHCFWGLGASAGPVVMSRCLVRWGSWNAGYMTIGILQFALVLVLFFSLPLWEKVRVSAQRQDNRQSPGIAGIIELPGAKEILVAFFCYCALEMTVGLWGSSFLVLRRGISADTAARWIALYYFGIMLGRLFSGFLAIKLRHGQMVRCGQFLIGAGIAVLLLPLNGLSLLAGFFLVGLGCAPIYPSLLHETPENFGKEHSQAIMGVQMASAYVGTTFMPPLFGILAAKTGYGFFPYFLGGLLLLMVFMVNQMYRRVLGTRICSDERVS